MSTTEYQYSIGLCQFTARLRGGRTLDKPVLEWPADLTDFRLPAKWDGQRVDWHGFLTPDELIGLAHRVEEERNWKERKS